MASNARVPLARYMQERTAGWTKVRTAIKLGLTDEKDTLFVINLMNDDVSIYDSQQLMHAIPTYAASESMAQLSAALQKRDPATGGQIFLIKLPDGEGFHWQSATIKLGNSFSAEPEVWTREMFNKMQAEKNC